MLSLFLCLSSYAYAIEIKETEQGAYTIYIENIAVPVEAFDLNVNQITSIQHVTTFTHDTEGQVSLFQGTDGDKDKFNFEIIHSTGTIYGGCQFHQQFVTLVFNPYLEDEASYLEEKCIGWQSK